jgi:hypothetical protein
MGLKRLDLVAGLGELKQKKIVLFALTGLQNASIMGPCFDGMRKRLSQENKRNDFDTSMEPCLDGRVKLHQQ